MSLKNSKIIEKIIKISTLSLLILIWVNLIFSFQEKKLENNVFYSAQNFDYNNYNYKNIKIKPLSWIAVAISVNLWIKYNEKNSLNDTIYNNIFSPKDFLVKQKLVEENILWKNLLFLKEYLNFVKIDFNKNLKNSNNKKDTLEIILNQLKLRLIKANSNAKNLLAQKRILEKEYNKVVTNINTIKDKIRYNYSKSKINNLYYNLQDYYELKNKETVYKSYILFINDLLKKYYIINEYNKIIINVLQLNKDIITKNSYLVIPEKWKELLKKYELMISEKDFKEKNKN